MARINLNTSDLIKLIDCLNDCIFRSSSTIKINQLESLKSRFTKALEGHEENFEKKESTKSSKRSKRSSPQV